MLRFKSKDQKYALLNCNISGELPWSDMHRTDRKEIESKKEQCRSSDALKTFLKDCPKVYLF